MIVYLNDGKHQFWNLFKAKGSVFPKALWMAVPSAFISVIFVQILHSTSLFKNLQEKDSIMSNNAIWGGFSFAVGFLVIFRTSQAYSRFWEGCTNMHKMGAEWYDACAALMAMTKHSEKPLHEILKFQNMLVRLFSMLHSAACGEIEESGIGNFDDEDGATGCFQMELIDASSIADESLLAVQNCDAKTEMIMQWIQQFIVENIKTGVLSIPPPILSRSFQEIASGMVHFNEALKIANVPFPFPYAQTCDMLLMLHWMVVPFVISQWVMKPWWAGIFAFIMVFTLWTLNFIAIQLENPFGCDANDIDGPRMQRDMNNHLRVLIKEETWKTPSFKSESKSQEQELSEQLMLRSRATELACGYNESFTQIWKDMHATECVDVCKVPSMRNGPVSRFRGSVAGTPKPGAGLKTMHPRSSARLSGTGIEIVVAPSEDKKQDRDDSFVQPNLQSLHAVLGNQPVESLGNAFAQPIQTMNGNTVVELAQPPNVSTEPLNGNASQPAPPLNRNSIVQSVQPSNGSAQSLNGNINFQPVQSSNGNAQSFGNTIVQQVQSLSENTILQKRPSSNGNAQPLNGNRVPETAAYSSVVYGDQAQTIAGRRPPVANEQGQTMASNLLGRDMSCWAVQSSAELPDLRGLSAEVPALLPRVLHQDIEVTPPGRGQFTAASEDFLMPMSQRSHISGDSRPMSQRSLFPPPPDPSSGKGRGKSWRLPLGHTQGAMIKAHVPHERFINEPQPSSQRSSQRKGPSLPSEQERPEV